MMVLNISSQLQDVITSLKMSGVAYESNIRLSAFSYLKTGGMAHLVLYPFNTEQVALCIRTLNENEIPYKVIGATSNLLFLDSGDYTCLLSTERLRGIRVDKANNEILVGSGEMLPDLARFALTIASLGFEGLEGIPGTVGGAVFMNAGAYGYEIRNVLKSVEVVLFSGEIRSYEVEELNLGKRTSNLRNGKIAGVIVACRFRVKEGIALDIERRMEIYHAKRHKYQDFLYPSLGSIFSGEVYKKLGERDKVFKIVSAVYYLLNYKLKLLSREAPINREWINKVAVTRFKLSYPIQPFSNKTLNCLVNRGQGTAEMVRYIREIQTITNSEIPLENEVVDPF